MRRWLVILPLVLLTLPPAQAEESSSYCGTYPDDMPFYGGWSGCKMKRLGEPPLWRGLPKGTRQVLRLTFTHGHWMFFRVVRIEQRLDGSATMTVRGTLPRRDYREPERTMLRRKIPLTAADMERINQLAEDSGVFPFERGTWDDQEEIYMHCQTLDMERVTAAGYRVSVVNIGCNQPRKLMPFVREVVRLAKMKNSEGGKLFY